MGDIARSTGSFMGDISRIQKSKFYIAYKGSQKAPEQHLNLTLAVKTLENDG